MYNFTFYNVTNTLLTDFSDITHEDKAKKYNTTNRCYYCSLGDTGATSRNDFRAKVYFKS